MAGHRGWLTIFVVAVTIAGAQRAWAQELPAFEDGRAAFAALDYAQALELFERSLREEELSREQAIEALHSTAVIHHAFGRTAKAEAAFVDLLAYDPKYRLPDDAAPQLRKIFKAARRRFERDRPPAPVAPSGGFDSDTPPELAGALVDADAPRADAPESMADLDADVLEVDGEQGSSGTGKLEYADPLTALEPTFADGLDRRPAVYETWWFWTIIGGVVVASAAAVTTGVLLSQPPAADYGPFQLESP